jgi:anti-sigma factor RsiW
MKLRGLKTRGLEPHTLAGAYAMDAISAPDRARFERHLAGCEECTQEIAGLREATARLATAAAVPPPSGLKERVMAAAAVTRQQPPGTETETPGRIPALGGWFRALTRPRRMVVAAAAVAVARAVEEVLRPGGLSLLQANGALAGQTVPHVHLHVLPRRAGDNLLMNWDRERIAAATAEPARIAAIAARLRARLGG